MNAIVRPAALPAPTATTLLPLPRRHYDDHEFLAPALEILETPPSPVRMSLMTSICAFAAAAVVWAYFGHVDIVATAQGKVQPVGRVKLVQPSETGKISRILVADGAHVHAGDTLIELEPDEAEAELRAAQEGLASARAEIARCASELAVARTGDFDRLDPVAWAAEVPTDLRQREDRVYYADLQQLRANIGTLEVQQAQKQAEYEQLQQAIATQQDLIKTLKERVDMRDALVSGKVGTRASLIDAMETLQYQVTQLALQRVQLVSAQKGAAVFAEQARKAIDDFITDTARKSADAERQAEDFSQKLAKARAERQRLTLRAPQDGIVQASVAINPGQVLSTGQEVMRIVPESGALEAEVYVQNRDIGFVKVGQPVIVKLEAFPFTHYGAIEARVASVAEDALPAQDAGLLEGDPAKPSSAEGYAGTQRVQNLVFPVRLTLGTSTMDVDGNPVRLTSGMAITADFKTGKRRIIEYLFSPLVEVAAKSLRER